MKVENESVQNNVHFVQSVQNDETEFGPSRAVWAVPSIACSRLDGDVSGLSCAKPTEDGNKSSMVGGKIKKNVWGVKKSGLCGWKMVVVDKQTSTNIHTKKLNAQPTSN